MRGFSAFALGMTLGFVLTRTDFCMHSAVRDAVARRAGPSVRIWLVALAVQLVVVNAIGALGMISIPLPITAPAAALVGGVAFGIGMVLAKG
jgi:uncharacterized membrane protein YedE/YeeE